MKSNLVPLMKSDKQDWRTPVDFFKVLDNEFEFDIDVADNFGITDYNNGKHYLCDSLASNWSAHGRSMYLNPPYETALQTRFIKQAAYVGTKELGRVVCLIPARTDTILWQDIIAPNANEIRFIKGRLKFEGADHPAPFPSALIIFGGDNTNQVIKFWDWKND